MYERYDFGIVFKAGFTPIQYRVTTVSSGAFNISRVMFIIVSILSGEVRFYLEAF